MAVRKLPRRRNNQAMERAAIARFMEHGNGGQACTEAGYSDGERAWRNLRKRDRVLVAIAKREQLAAEIAAITPARVLAELGRIAFADIRDVVTIRNGKAVVAVDDLAKLTPAQAAAIAEIAETKDGIRVKMHGKIAALTELAKRLIPEDAAPAPALRDVTGTGEPIDGKVPREVVARIGAVMGADMDRVLG